MKNKIKLFICTLIFTCNATVFGEPYLPKSESEILEKLPAKFGISFSSELSKLHKKLSNEPNNLEKTIDFAKYCIELGRSESDPRYIGYAEAALKNWLKKPNPPSDVLVLEAIIKQYNHNFKSSLEYLSKALNTDPQNSQAWITKAQIHTTLGEYEEAKKSCAHLLRLTNQLVSVSCISNAASLNGEAEKSYMLLNQILSDAKELPLISSNEKLWGLTLLSDIAARLGNNDSAETHFKEALKLNPDDNYLLAVYSDFLLGQKKYKEVINLLNDRTQLDALLLRLAVAEKAVNSPNLETHINDLRTRFADSGLREESIHKREEAMFLLKLLNNPKKALVLAKKNWTDQKEPIDAKILLECAIAANARSSAKPVLGFIEKNRLEDIQLLELKKKLERLNK
ncbi:MAG: tetratricopeptide repeat protein [Candidatus Melainabacteria bacterium]|nr:tetratricopeptide repeat protein [Candidatus Melainabacteria bacterium]